MLLDQPVILAIDGAWKRFVRVVGSLGDSPAPASEPPVEDAPWSSADWQRSLDLLAVAPPRAGQGSAVGPAPSGPPTESGFLAAPSLTDEDEDDRLNAAAALSAPVNDAAGDMAAIPAATVNSDAVSGRRVEAALMRALLLSGQGRLDEAESAFPRRSRSTPRSTSPPPRLSGALAVAGRKRQSARWRRRAEPATP